MLRSPRLLVLAVTALFAVAALVPLAAYADGPTGTATSATPVPYPIVQVFAARLQPGQPTCTSALPAGEATAKQLRVPAAVPGRAVLRVAVSGLRCTRDHDLAVVITSDGRSVRVGAIHIDANGNGRAKFTSSPTHPLPRFHDGDEITVVADSAFATGAVVMKGTFHELLVP